jgi:hypothetical protein
MSFVQTVTLIWSWGRSPLKFAEFAEGFCVLRLRIL